MATKLQIKPPFPISSIDNGFGGATGALLKYYQGLGLLGHPGIDFGIDYGMPIPNAVDGAVVSAIISKDNPNLSAFRAVNTIIDFDDVSYEIQYGHCSNIFANIGQKYIGGSVIADVGNTGDVFSNGVEVTNEEKQAGSKAGSHCHLQVRVLKRVPANDSSYEHYLNDGHGRLVMNGFAYAVPDFDNGYNGCVDPRQFFVDDLKPTQNDDLDNVIKAEVEVLSKTTDSTVRKSFIALIISQIMKKLGYE